MVEEMKAFWVFDMKFMNKTMTEQLIYSDDSNFPGFSKVIAY